ncbi:MAG: amidohydrolase [Anaerolineaceae bacterium]|nr:amidohydrolase [Anaerolineaceae bacterium]
MNDAVHLFEYTQELRRDFHRHPEIGFQENRTAGIVAQELTKMGLAVTRGVARTGVVALLDSGKPGPTLLIRSDMDALPVTEETGAEYASQTPGTMHACGHDGHMAIMLTVAHMLYERRATLRGIVKFVFQPAEEGLGGAETMISEGVMDNPRPDHTLALHLWNERPVGWIGLTPGPLMAGSDAFKVRISGVGGHGALPQQTVDPVLAAAHIITALQSIVSRNIAPLQSAVISVCKLQAGETHNVTPQFALMEGTIRYFEEPIHQEINLRFHQIVEGIAEAMGCNTEIMLRTLTPPVVNDPAITGRLHTMASRDFPKLKIDQSYQTMVSEDMAFFMNAAPGTFVLMGSANYETGLAYGHHHPRFDFDESVLPLAANFITTAAEELLSSLGT